MIIITGASDGLGLELAKLYNEQGKTVVNVSRRACEYADHQVLHDLTKGSEIEKAAAAIMAIDEPIEALINGAGILSVQKLNAITETEVSRVMSTNVEAPILLVSRLIDRIKKDGADIVNVSSTVGTKAYAEQAAYGASKWALRGFSANLQVELKDTSCRVISFCTGGFASNIFEKATGQKNQDFTHWMTASDVAKHLKNILELPKNMEVSEIILNRKAIK